METFIPYLSASLTVRLLHDRLLDGSVSLGGGECSILRTRALEHQTGEMITHDTFHCHMSQLNQQKQEAETTRASNLQIITRSELANPNQAPREAVE
ncbi:hypothetical protein E2C01_044957 [Portunus trituberculatus]|uniref:Uncharacterized protein n=1 Tax=Portunus trituberculatus TaxID=210409 RepID=A0A5B7G1V2_PORTR|nr:hypothetical protein [Portunus trituberculatus]